MENSFCLDPRTITAFAYDHLFHEDYGMVKYVFLCYSLCHA